MGISVKYLIIPIICCYNFDLNDIKSPSVFQIFIPISGDQPANAKEAERIGLGMFLSYQELLLYVFNETLELTQDAKFLGKEVIYFNKRAKWLYIDV